MKIKSDKRQLTEGSNVENSITTVFRIFVFGKVQDYLLPVGKRGGGGGSPEAEKY